MDYYNSTPKRKVFISYYHHDDQAYKDAFERTFGHLFINKSVQNGDINTDVSTEYIKRLIQSPDFLADASVLIVLCGPNTKGRKHVDWEISGALNTKLNGCSGVVGILLPQIPLNGRNYDYDSLPPRLADNVKSGYAAVHLWNEITSNANFVNDAIEAAFLKRSQSQLIDNTRLQMARNTSGI